MKTKEMDLKKKFKKKKKRGLVINLGRVAKDGSTKQSKQNIKKKTKEKSIMEGNNKSSTSTKETQNSPLATHFVAIGKTDSDIQGERKKRKRKNRKPTKVDVTAKNHNGNPNESLHVDTTTNDTAHISKNSMKGHKRNKKKRKHSPQLGAGQVTNNFNDGTFENVDTTETAISTKKVCENKQVEGISGVGSTKKRKLEIHSRGADESASISKFTNSKVSKKREKFKNSKNSSLRERMLSRLSAARFRYINEELYTWNGSELPTIFGEDPESFKEYHSGFKQQTKLWPINPIDVIIKSIKMKTNFNNKVIADFGCGEAKVAQELPTNKVYSFDLVALNEYVTVCDNAHTKLYSNSIDIAVHCLSLMSTNIASYIKEANRVLKIGGVLKIAEVESRFEQIDDFVANVCKFCFKLVKKDLSHNLFYFLDFEKIGDIGVARKRKLPVITLLPCLYKKR